MVKLAEGNKRKSAICCHYVMTNFFIIFFINKNEKFTNLGKKKNDTHLKPDASKNFTLT